MVPCVITVLTTQWPYCPLTDLYGTMCHHCIDYSMTLLSFNISIWYHVSSLYWLLNDLYFTVYHHLTDLLTFNWYHVSSLYWLLNDLYCPLTDLYGTMCHYCIDYSITLLSFNRDIWYHVSSLYWLLNDLIVL